MAATFALPRPVYDFQAELPDYRDYWIHMSDPILRPLPTVIGRIVHYGPSHADEAKWDTYAIIFETDVLLGSLSGDEHQGYESFEAAWDAAKGFIAGAFVGETILRREDLSTA